MFGVPLIIGAPLIIAEQDDSAELWREPHDARDGVHDTDTPPCEIHTVCTLYGVSHREGGCLMCVCRAGLHGVRQGGGRGAALEMAGREQVLPLSTLATTLVIHYFTPL